jgi:sulfite exporter TauE/SafE
MSLGSVVSSGFVMGFSASLVCLGWCVPVIMPYTATGERPGIRSGLLTGGLFSLGRLVSYLALMSVFLAFRSLVPLSPDLGTAATLLSGLILILSGLSATGAIKLRASFASMLCRRVAGSPSPFYLGVLTGLRPCGPLLAAMAFLLALPSAMTMGIFIASFWVASSLLVLILSVVGGGISVLAGKKVGIERVRTITGMAMIFIGFFLILVSVGGMTISLS